ncbi:MarR family winged helix-turn-helix transcriptional regulator [Rhodococcus sp. GXMU-t2271]|uniref:MarR family transcriptional regulator n=3 Tax=Rhodococcus TaxID=1827 RepID=M2XYI4_9NOCA|nr:MULTISPECIES: MarR family winged helix-turn-helix transcriptional regulator [Rhodococcus]EME66031.1 MarR family transcriptional regulator [Rhodococcus ruber BKS 20-38]KOS55108.1 MarR family transcriptional regulator [Rhodococcus rhodochrous KG-21]MDM7490387.1 MarR family winged helix-turn-helix transcriptional regulator [Rhodococcus indonesiensis]
MAVQPDTAHALVDAIFLFGRTLRTTLANSTGDALPTALTGVLFVLWRMGECRPSELAAELCMSQSALSRQLGELVERGMVDRHRDPDDRRAHRVSVSETGHKVLREIRDRRASRLHELLGGWDQAQAESALGALAHLNDTLSVHDTTGRNCL